MQPMTLQDVFTQAVIGFRAQDYVRSSKAGMCLYRGANGAKCLIGHAIPDDKYKPAWDTDGGGGVSMVWGDPDFRSMFVEDIDQQALTDLQLIHDLNASVEMHGTHRDYIEDTHRDYIEGMFRDFADNNNLIYPEV